MIEVKGLTKVYGDNIAVRDLSLTIEKGKIYGLLGANGAGKSTTMNIITGYLGATKGEVIVGGHDIVKNPVKAKEKIGYLPEIPPVYPDMKVREYLSFVAELKKVPSKDRAEEVKRVMGLTGLTEVTDKLIANLSKGFKQRVGLAGAITGNPDIIILDEPTVGLDPVQIIDIRNLIRSLAEDHAVVLSSHILSEISEICDHIFIIANGRLVASDSTENLIRQQSEGNVRRVKVTFKGKEEDVDGLLKKIEGIENYGFTSSEEGEVKVELTTPSDLDVREVLFYAAAEARIPIIALAEEIESLEDVFIQMAQAANAEEDSSEDVNTEQLTSDSETETLSTDDDTENLTSDDDAEQSETTSNTDVLIDGLRKTLSGKESD
ncbi:MAG: ABC transporter ATP-binding protein [Eubacterium sp.]|nr:ABC transporter ATP-binding protein [Eubacterium sp.]